MQSGLTKLFNNNKTCQWDALGLRRPPAAVPRGEVPRRAQVWKWAVGGHRRATVYACHLGSPLQSAPLSLPPTGTLFSFGAVVEHRCLTSFAIPTGSPAATA